MAKIKHGHSIEGSRSATYVVWCVMIQRCTNPKNPTFPRYGGRGISVCKRWRNFPAFLRDMGERPPGMTIERINNDKGYSPSNCRWATPDEQRANTSRTRLVDTSAGKMPLFMAARAAGITPASMLDRLEHGWSPDEILAPKRRHRRDEASITIEGKTKTLMEWARSSGVGHTTIRYRLAAGVTGKALIKRS